MICFVLNCRGHQHYVVRLVVRKVAGSLQLFPSSFACFPAQKGSHRSMTSDAFR